MGKRSTGRKKFGVDPAVVDKALRDINFARRISRGSGAGSTANATDSSSQRHKNWIPGVGYVYPSRRNLY